ncbi:MAG: BirA family biotin operon repressor/biotin-[acetyl-CoA-carboxylase] ligase [Flavobacteriales bacterium]|jgi:BirA family biotin operon repressor/biotin-[acetyl-CoA-carboxylase] ligase
MNTLFIGHKLIHLDSVDSTNKYAAKLVSLPEWVEGTVIVADEQLQGKGRHDRVWNSHPGQNLMCSILFKPTFLSSKHIFLLQMMSALAVSDALNFFLPNSTKVKWPNDIYIGSEKISGILTETSLRGTSLTAAIIGIGVNLNQTDYEGLKATSLRLQLGNPIERSLFLSQLCSHVEARYLEMKNRPTKLVKDYHSCLFGLGAPLQYTYRGSEITAVLQHVEMDGTATFITANGKISCRIDDIKWIG